MAGGREQSWQKWWAMAQDSLKAARLLEQNGHTRSCVSRFYYAAYQAATAVLLYQGLQPPKDLEEREAWSHIATPDLLRKTVYSFWTADERHKLSARLKSLYKLRLVADYKGKIEIEPSAFLRSLKDVVSIVNRVKTVLPSDQ